jgi:hypothetical protein
MANQKGYPRVSMVQDINTQQALREIWNALHQVSDTVASHATQLTTTQANVTTLQSGLDSTQKFVRRLAPAMGTDQSSTTTNAYFGPNYGTGSGIGSGGPGGSGGGSGGGGGSSGPPSGPGSIGDPIVPMSADPTIAEDQVKRSLAFWGRTDYSYWAGLIHIPGMEPWQGGDSKWYVGWDAYFEQRASPTDPGSADQSLLPLPAVHQDPVPGGYPPGGWT